MTLIVAVISELNSGQALTIRQLADRIMREMLEMHETFEA